MGAQATLVQVSGACFCACILRGPPMMGTNKILAAACLLSFAGMAAGAGCYCSCCKWVWCDDCQHGCCFGSMCSTPNCHSQPSPTPPPTPPPPPQGWNQIGTGCCTDDKCGSNLMYREKLGKGVQGCMDQCRSIGAVWMNTWINDDSYCACYAECDCSVGDSQANCNRWRRQNAFWTANVSVV